MVPVRWSICDGKPEADGDDTVVAKRLHGLVEGVEHVGLRA